STKEFILGTDNSQLHEVTMEEKDKKVPNVMKAFNFWFLSFLFRWKQPV
ncbi:hypothetical protein A2U01_0036077, partial [Trifolium medium]|nr:hypothetical protein [Trifolium medium]